MAIHRLTGFEGCDDYIECLAILNGYEYYNSYGVGSYLSTGGYLDGCCIRLRNTHVYKDRGIRILSLLPASLVGKTVAVGGHYFTDKVGYTVSNYGNGSIFAFHGPDIRIYNDGGDLIVHRGTTNIATFEGGGFGTGVWHYIEVLLFSDSSVGTITIRLDGQDIYSKTGLNTGGQDVVGIRLSSSMGTTDISAYYDNLYFADDLQGVLQMLLKRPNGDYDADDFTCSSGTDRYALIDGNFDGDSSYIESGTVGHTAVFDYEDISENGKIAAVQVNTVAKADASGPRTIQHVYVQDSVEYLGNGGVDSSEDDGFELTLSYPGQEALHPAYFEVLNTQPDGSEWNIADFNDMKIGVVVAA